MTWFTGRVKMIISGCGSEIVARSAGRNQGGDATGNLFPVSRASAGA
jgi:hypothetical protein